MIEVEGGHMIENRLDYLDALAKRGMTYMTLTWNNSTSVTLKMSRSKALQRQAAWFSLIFTANFWIALISVNRNNLQLPIVQS